MDQELKALERQIIQTRQKLHILIGDDGDISKPDVIKTSHELDDILEKYNRLKARI